ncbi:MAG: cysL [Firmicutes bacterium]|nr:cysL [Bacillota bacterium]
MLHCQSLAVFNAVAEKGSFMAAAKKLNITQPTVSFHIEKLESSLRCPLFQRLHQGVVLTNYGKIFLHHASQINVQMSAAQNQIDAMLKDEEGNISHPS